MFLSDAVSQQVVLGRRTSVKDPIEKMTKVSNQTYQHILINE